MTFGPENHGDQNVLTALDAFEADDGVLAFVQSFGDEGKQALLCVATDAQGQYRDEQRERAVHILGRLEWPEAYDPLVELLRDKSAMIRVSAIYALGSIGRSRSVVPLIDILRNDALGVTERAHALRVLGEVGNRAVLQEIESVSSKDQSVELRLLASGTAKRLRGFLSNVVLDLQPRTIRPFQ